MLSHALSLAANLDNHITCLLRQCALEVLLRVRHNKVLEIMTDALDMGICCSGCFARYLRNAIKFFAYGSCFLHLLLKSVVVSEKTIGFFGK